MLTGDVCSFGRDQTCAMLLAVASGNTFLDPAEQSPLGTVSSVSLELVSTAKLAFYEVGERPFWSERVVYGAPRTSSQLPCVSPLTVSQRTALGL